MSDKTNRQVKLVKRPQGIPEASDFEIVQAALPSLAPGHVLVRNIYLSVEPAMRGWVNAAANYAQPVPLQSVMPAFTAGRVVASQDPDWPVGTAVTGKLGWQDYAVAEAGALERVHEADGLPLSTALGVMGINGVSAHYGLLEIGQPRAGETVIVSTAAGAVGSCVGQIAKIRGCRTVGIAGGPAKVRQCLETFGFDAAVDYKAPDFEAALAAACGEGVDVYFDNTCGPISDAVMRHLKQGARIVVCGTASIANWDPLPQGPRVERHLLVKRARMQGFVIFDHPGHGAVARRELSQWIREGKLQYAQDILQGIEQAPGAIAGLYRGENQGKRLIQIASEP